MSKYWYILQTFTAYERKIEQQIRTLIEKGDISGDIVTDVRVPIEETATTVNGKKHVKKDMFLPGYVMLEMDLPTADWRATCSVIRRIHGVSGFVGTNPNERPRPITADEAKNLLTKAGVIKGEKPVKVMQTFNVGDNVKITEGPFASFSGEVEYVNEERDKLRVNVEIFGRITPVEVTLAQVEKI